MQPNSREEWYDAERRVAVTLVDVTEAAQSLARGHLAGPVASYFLTKALAAAALLGAETSERGESVIVQMKCQGPLGGFNVECTDEGTLRGYTERKTLEEFDGLVRQPIGLKDLKRIVGDRQLQVTRSVPGRILSQGISSSLDGYLAGSLQRKACIHTEALVSDEVEVQLARGILIEELPDAKATGVLGQTPHLGVASRKLLAQLGLDRAELKRTTPLKFACRCSPDRALAMLAALSAEERGQLPEKLDITCHMCGRTFTVKTR